MKSIPVIFLLLLSWALYVTAQSGRRVATTRTAPSAPIQPTLTPEPQPPATTVTTGELMFLPESLREREIKGIKNGNFRLADFSGKVIVINLWASWCGPCRREVPDYEKVRKFFTGQEVEFIGLTAEDQRFADQVHKFLTEVNFGFRLGWADRDLARTLMNGRGSIPQTIIIDNEGHIVNHWTGYSSGASGERLRRAINNALGR